MQEKITEKAQETPSFEFLMHEIDRILSEMERGNIDQLDQLIANYEYGTSIIAKCNRILKDAEIKVNKITEQIQRETGKAHA